MQNTYESSNLLHKDIFVKRNKIKKSRVKKSRGEIVLYSVMFIIILINCLTIVGAFAITVVNSFKDPFDYALGNTWKLPTMGWHIENYIEIFSTLEVNGTYFGGMLWNSLWQTLGQLLLTIASTAMASYAYAKYKFFGRKAIFFIVVVLLTISLPGSIPATYKLYSDLHMRNSYLFLIGCTAGFGANFLIFVGFWRSIDWAYAEAAYIDGASEWQVFVKVMIPQGLPIMGVSIINGFIAQWLSADPSMLYLPEMPSLGYGLWVYQQRSAGSMNYPVFFAALIVVAIPSVIAFICLHDKTIKAMNLGGLKG